MIHAYNEIYLNTVMKNLAALFDLAINAEGYDEDTFSDIFSKSDIASGIESGTPDMLAGKSATELLIELIGKDCEYTNIPTNRTPQYWAGWVLAYAQWYLNKSFTDIFSVMPFSQLVNMYHPYHEADEMKTIEIIQGLFPNDSPLKRLRQERKLTQEQLAALSGVKVRSIRSYEQGTNDLSKAQGETLMMLAKALSCTVENLLS